MMLDLRGYIFGQHGSLLALSWDIDILGPESPFKKPSHPETTMLKGFLERDAQGPQLLDFSQPKGQTLNE